MHAFATFTTVSLSLVAAANAIIAPASPIASTTCKAGKACKISWVENNEQPLASAFGPTTVGLYVGNRLQQTLLQAFGTISDPSSQLSISPTIDPTSGPAGADYFIRFQSVSAKDDDGYPLQAFSAKFTLSGMNGTFSEAIQNQIAGVTSGVNTPEVITATGGAAASVSNLAQTASPASATKNASTDADSGASRTTMTAAAGLALVGFAASMLM